MTFKLESSAFTREGDIPRKHTCDGDDVSPPLAWSGAPDGTNSFALIVQDPDAPDPAAPKTTFVHWVLYDLPPSCHALAEHTTSNALPPGAREGLNDWKATGYRGPCPPVGRHRYYFRLFALDTKLGDLGTPRRDDVERAMRDHVLDRAELMGTYQRG